MLLNTIAFAGEAVAGAGAGQTTNSMVGLIGTFLPLVLLFVLFYFILIRPQKKKDKLLREMIASLAPGDKIHTIGGIIGKINKVKDDEILIETGSTGNPNEKSFMKITKWSVKEVIKQEQA